MPVRKPDSENPAVNPFRRLSASQVNAWRKCPRLWYYGWMARLKSPLPPQILRGNAVEECVCRVLRESPTLISHDSKSPMTTPLAEDGSPDWDSDVSWVGPGLSPLPAASAPSDRESLQAWALARADAHFERCWESAIREWEASPNRVGLAEDIDKEEGRAMVEEAISLHMDQVQSCFESGGGPDIDGWRAGNRQKWPAPDGFPRNWETPHPAAVTGSVTWAEAWEVARPWFVDPDAKSFTQTSVHPEDWFQGEYDLVYRWRGEPTIVDLKASIGKGDRSGDYLDQLRMYAWLWWETHEREEAVSGLEIWYLGTGTVKLVEIPTEEEMSSLNKELEDLYLKIHSKDPRIEDCPPDPSPLRFFDRGGVPAETPVHPDERARCSNCDYRGFCEGSDHEIELPLESRVERFGHAWPVTPIGEIETRASVVGEVVGLQGPEILDDGSISLEFTLQDGYDRARVRPSRQGFPRRVTRAISEGSRVRVDDGMPSLWRGQLQIDLDERAAISIATEDDEAPVVEVETRVSVVGRVWSIDAYPNGVDVNRWSITLMDKTGSAASVAFKQFVPLSAAAIARGDEIAILNGEVGEWAGRPQVRIGPGARVVILRHSEDTPGF
ncbi:MAG: hypothetical protein CMB78_01400 [Euryarchaeota archaeon]|nr:hypothetical protein [Euryarchaeota archaeon]